MAKVAGATFATSLLERVIEERAGGDKSRAEVQGARLAAVRPVSEPAAALKALPSGKSKDNNAMHLRPVEPGTAHRGRVLRAGAG